MKFQSLSEEELASLNLIPEGYYKYKVIDSKDKSSQSGSEMIELKVDIYVPNRMKTVFDYLLEAMMHKVYHFCKVNNLMDKYEKGLLSSRDCFGKGSGYVQIITQKDKTGKYADKSVIKDYFESVPQSKESKPVTLGNHDEPPPGFDDDLPPF